MFFVSGCKSVSCYKEDFWSNFNDQLRNCTFYWLHISVLEVTSWKQHPYFNRCFKVGSLPNSLFHNTPHSSPYTVLHHTSRTHSSTFTCQYFLPQNFIQMCLSFPEDYSLSHCPTMVTRQWSDLNWVYLTPPTPFFFCSLFAWNHCVTRLFDMSDFLAGSRLINAFVALWCLCQMLNGVAQLYTFAIVEGTIAWWSSIKMSGKILQNNNSYLPCYEKHTHIGLAQRGKQEMGLYLLILFHYFDCMLQLLHEGSIVWVLGSWRERGSIQ